MMTVVKNVRRASSTDFDAILAIERACVEVPHWNAAVWENILTQDEQTGVERVSFVAEGNGEMVGFVVVSCACGVSQLESIAVRDSARRQGVGSALCREVMGWLKGRVVQVIELEVRASNVGALSLYGSMGFLQTGRRRGYYRDPIEDAVLMSAPLRC